MLIEIYGLGQGRWSYSVLIRLSLWAVKDAQRSSPKKIMGDEGVGKQEPFDVGDLVEGIGGNLSVK